MKQNISYKTVFIGIEDQAGGIGDLIVKYIKNRFENECIRVKHKPCQGGSYKDMSSRARKFAGNDEYDLRLFVWDADRLKHANDKIEQYDNWHCLLCDPCVEGEILRILGEEVGDSAQCKKALMAISRLDHIARFESLLDGVENVQFMKSECFARLIHAIRAAQ